MADAGSNGGINGGEGSFDWSELLNGILTAEASSTKKGKTNWREIERLMALDTQMNRTDRNGLFSGWEWSEDPETGRWTQTQTVPDGMVDPSNRLMDRANGMGMNPYASPEQFGSMLDAKMANQMNQQGILSQQPDLRRLFGDYANSRDGMFPSGYDNIYGNSGEAQDDFFLDGPDPSDGNMGPFPDGNPNDGPDANNGGGASQIGGSSGGTGSTGGGGRGGGGGGNGGEPWRTRLRDSFYNTLPYGASAAAGTAGWLATKNPMTAHKFGEKGYGWGQRLRKKNSDTNSYDESRGSNEFVGPPSSLANGNGPLVIDIINGNPQNDPYNPTIHDDPYNNRYSNMFSGG